MARRAAADPSEAIGVAVVKYNYQAQQPDELSLVKGSRILILEKSNDGWWRGQSGTITGWFPSNYTQEECDLDDTMHTYAMAENVLDIVVALYSFSSSNDQELSFEKGDRLEILDRPPSDPEWLVLLISYLKTFSLLYCTVNSSFYAILSHLSGYFILKIKAVELKLLFYESP